MTLFLVMMINLSISFIFMSHPISMGMILLLQTLSITLFMNIFMKNSWFSYIMFLIMIGGLLIIFIYMTSLISNKKFKFSLKILLLNISILMIYLLMNNYLMTNNFYLFNQLLQFNYNKYINSMTIFLMIISICYLLMTMIATVKITQFKSGPLRQKF